MNNQFITFEMALKAANIKSPYHQLGNQIELRPVTLTNSKGEYIENSNKYGNLYKNGIKLSDEVFRIGGFGGSFKNELYCSVIHYKKTNPKIVKSEHDLFDSGKHCLINDQGQIVMHCDYNYYYLGGNVVYHNSKYISVLTNKEFFNSSSNNIIGKNYIIVSHTYNFGQNNIPVGIYKIDKLTCEVIKIDELNK